MKKTVTIVLLLSIIALSGCTTDEKNTSAETEISTETESNDEKTEEEDSEPEPPKREEVLAARELALEDMSEEEAERLTENIKTANLVLEQAYMYDNIFGKLEDKDSLYWNYFDQTGKIQIGWAYEGDIDKKEVMEEENLTEEEFYSKYGSPVVAENHYDAEVFAELLADMKSTVNNENLQNDLQQIIDNTKLAAETHEMEYANNIYKLVHDMDYFLLRYGPDDVGSYVQDKSMISRYYGTLSFYD